MNFMDDEDFLVLMAHCEDRAHGFEKQHILTMPERKRLYDVGIRTAQEQPAWMRVHPSRDSYDFGYVDNIINRNREAGLKSMLQLPGWRVPRWVSQEWKAKRQDGIFEDEALSFWNEEAQAYTNEYCQTVIDHYPEEDIGFFFGLHQGGEGAYPPTWCVFDQATLDDYKDVFGSAASPPDIGNPETMKWFGDKVIEQYMDKAKILYPRHKEAWNAQQSLMDKWSKAYGNFVQPEIMTAYRELFPDICVVLMQWTYFDDSHRADEVNHVDHLIEISNCETIVEAMFCGGLPTTTPKAIAKGFRGQVVMPVHEIGKSVLEDWMVNNIRDSYNLWKESYENHSNL